jgi:exo-1,4-beta-D-glucosaminidase
LNQGWVLQAASKAGAGPEISAPGFKGGAWFKAKVPSTILGTLVDDGVYKDPFMGRNLAAISTEPFKEAWWYRTEFQVTAADKHLHTRLILDGVNYRADVWLNGRKLAGKDAVYGTYRTFDLDVSRDLVVGANALAIEVHPSAKGDYTMGFVDWNPSAPDRNMGLFREVKLRRTGPVSLENVAVNTEVDLKTLEEASVTVAADLVNHEATETKGAVEGEIGSIHFRLPYTLAPNETRAVKFSPAAFPALRMHKPRLWWPTNLGEPSLYTLRLTAGGAKAPSDTYTTPFGIRQVETYLDAQGARGFKINGRKVLIRGGGWVDDLFLREDAGNLEAQFRHVKNMNLNTVRLEGFWGSSQKVYEIADRMGILVMAGFSCQWEWPEYLGAPQDDETYGAARSSADVDLLASYLRDQVRSLRNHPSVLVWVLGSDKLPWPQAEKRYLADLAALDPSRPHMSSTKGWTSTLSGPTGVKMLGPYDYVSPNYWFEDKANGGAYGFNTETGPGPQIPPLSTLKKMIPAADLWPMGKAAWDYHCGRNEFNTLDTYMAAFNARYGPCASVEEFAFKAQAANYEAMRAMFEAFGVNQPRATGVVQWMLNACWPKLYWQLYDYYLAPNGAYYGAQKGSQPRTVVYDCAARTVHVVNDTREPMEGLTVRARILDAASKQVFEREMPVSCPPGASVKVLDLKDVEAGTPVHFLDLRLSGKGGAVASNFYWLSAKPDVLDYPKSTWVTTPMASYADFKGLGALPGAEVKVASTFGKEEALVTLSNPTDHVAFFLELGLVPSGADEALPTALWEDNYVSLLPHETRTLHVRYRQEELKAGEPRITLTGWNVPPRH